MSFGGQSNAWERSMMQQHPQSNFHQGPQMSFMQTSQQNNMAAFHSMYPSAGGGGGGSVQYPSRLNPVAFQGSGGGMSGGGVGVGGGGGMPQQTHYNSIGTVTKINNDCGLVNNEVFFYRNVCKGPEPKLGDRVIFEATYSTSGQFKWNATRIQMMQSKPQPIINTTKLSYGSPVPMQNDYPQRGQVQRHASPIRVLSPVRGAAGNRHERDRRDRERERERHHRSRDRDDDEHDRKRRREDHVVRNNSSNRAGGPSNAIARSDRERERDRETRRERERDQSERERERDHPRERERERDREKDKDKEREREKPREPETRSVVPKGPGRRARAAARRYMVQIPKYLLAHKSADVQEVRNRYTSLYIPSDFFHAKMKWTETFTPDNPFSLRRPCQFHIMHRIVESPYEQSLDDLEVADADYVYSAKVMLMSLPSIGEIYRKCFESKEEENVHPTRLINFLVGLRGRNEPMAIGGPWSPSLDGENPDTDPSVLIRTAIRTCKALTGIDLSNCTQWYRFVELYYHRTEYKNMEKDAPPRVETVVIYLPDVHSCMPTIAEHESLSALYKTTYDNVIARRTAAYNKAVAAASTADDNNESTNTEADNAEEGNVAAEDQNDEGDGDDVDNNMDAEGNGADAEDDDENVDADDGGDDNNAEAGEENENGDGEETEQMDMDNSGAANEEADDDTDMGQNADHAPEAGDENEEDPTPEPTHYTLLDLKAMKVQEIRDELLARDLPDDGVRNIVLARLAKALKTEKAEEMKAQLRLQKLKQPKNAAKNASEKKEDSKKSGKNNDMDDSKDEWADAIDFELSDIVILDEYDSSKNPEDKELTEKEKSQLLRRYTLPTTPHIVVHPNKLAKGGNFDCAVMSLSVLLDYRAEDTKERYFELYLFAELFNEMLMRDFAFNIYKEIYLYHGKEESSENNAEAKSEAEPSAETNGGSGEEKSPKESGKDAESVEEAKPIRKRRMSTVDGKEGDSGGEKKANPPKRRMSTIDGRDIQSSSDDKKLATSSKPQRRMSTVDGPESSNETGKNETGKKMTVAKPHLLLSFLYFDTNQCGYIFERDLEDLFAVLGLNLSRSQIKKVLGKLSAFSISSVDRVRQSIYYRKLTDKEETAESTPCIEDVDDLALEELRDIASGNNKYEFVFGESHLSNCLIPLDGDENNDADLINYNGTVIHVGKLMDQIKRTEKNYSDMEKLYNDLMKQHSDLQKEHSKTSSKIKDLQSDTKSLSRKLTDTNQDLYSLNRKFRDQNSTLSYIYTRVAPYFIREKEKEKDSKSESSPKDKDDKKKDEEKPKDEKEHKDKTPADKHHKDKSKDKESDKEKVKEGGGEKTGHSKEAENVKEKPKPKETEKEKSKETEKEKEKTKVTEKGKEKSKETEKEKEKEKSKETEKEKSKEMEKEKTKETEKEKQKSKETEKENDTSMEVDNDKETEKETCEEKATSTTPKETEKVKKEEDKKEAATPAAAAAPVKTVPVKESSDKVTKPKASETPKPAPATPNAATSTKATVAKAKPAAAAAKPATSTPAKPQAAAAANAKPANATTNAKPAQTSTPAKAVAKTAPNKATPAKATPAKTAPAKQASGTPAKPAAAKATPAKVNPNAKKQAAGAIKKVTPSENSQK